MSVPADTLKQADARRQADACRQAHTCSQADVRKQGDTRVHQRTAAPYCKRLQRLTKRPLCRGFEAAAVAPGGASAVVLLQSPMGPFSDPVMTNSTAIRALTLQFEGVQGSTPTVPPQLTVTGMFVYEADSPNKWFKPMTPSDVLVSAAVFLDRQKVRPASVPSSKTPDDRPDRNTARVQCSSCAAQRSCSQRSVWHCSGSVDLMTDLLPVHWLHLRGC